MPLVILKFSETYMQLQFAGYLIWEPLLSTLIGLSFVISYVLVSQKRTNPTIYRSFGELYGEVTRKIFYRTLLQSLLLGSALYIIVLALSNLTIEFSSILYVVFILLLVVPIIEQEKRIGKLRLLKKFQSHVNVETLEKNLLKYVTFAFFIVVAISLQIIQILPHDQFQAILNLIFSFILILCALGFFFSILYSDRGDIVKLKDTAEAQLKAEDFNELRTNVNKVNS